MKIHENLKQWLISNKSKYPDFEKVINKIDKLVEYKNTEKLKFIKQKMCKDHEWISSLSDDELNEKSNIILDYKTTPPTPTDKRWHYGRKVCKLCGIETFDWFCPHNKPFHSCCYDGSEYCTHCGLPYERK